MFFRYFVACNPNSVCFVVLCHIYADCALLAEQSLGGITDFVTYVNPNMGFTGSSYLASGWRMLGDEPGTKYRYLDDRYITDRRLAVTFGKHDDASYRKILGDRFSVSNM